MGQCINMDIYNINSVLCLAVYNWGYTMDIGMIEANTVILKKTVKYLNGEVKEIVEKQIKSNYKTIDNFFDDLEKEYQSTQSYEQGGA